MLRVLGVILLGVFGCMPQCRAVTWELINEYPANSLTGEGDAFFAERVKQKTGGELIIIPISDAKSKLRTQDQLKAVADGRYAMADSFAGGLGEESPVFLLTSLPFVTSSSSQARLLFKISRPVYEKLFAERKQKLLYISPWPPAGLWSTTAVRDPHDLKILKVRTYDQTSAEVLSQVAASGNFIPFSELNPKLESGDITAVLSSGDGGAGRHLWNYLHYFTEIKYAIPLSFATVSLEVWTKLDQRTRRLVEEAAAETTAHQWAALKNRVDENYERMREKQVAITTEPSAELMQVLHAASEKPIRDWEIKVGQQAADILRKYHAQLHRQAHLQSRHAR